jgi:BMFP domain-containing protein YqiC
MLPSHDVWKPMLLSMLIEAMAQNAKLEHRIQVLEEAGVTADERQSS